MYDDIIKIPPISSDTVYPFLSTAPDIGPAIATPIVPQRAIIDESDAL